MNRPGDPPRPFREHLEELRSRLIRALVGLGAGIGVSFLLHKYLMVWVVYPLRLSGYEENLQVLAPTEAILEYLKIDLLFGTLLASPWIAYQFWMFVNRGLKPGERSSVYANGALSVVLFIAGVSFTYGLLCPFALPILIEFDPAGVTRPALTLSHYISFLVQFSFALGLAFQLPVIMRFLSGARIVNKSTWKQWRKQALLTMFIIAAFLTPAEPITQISLALPLMGLYELGILLIREEDENKMEESRPSPD